MATTRLPVTRGATIEHRGPAALAACHQAMVHNRTLPTEGLVLNFGEAA